MTIIFIDAACAAAQKGTIILRNATLTDGAGGKPQQHTNLWVHNDNYSYHTRQYSSAAAGTGNRGNWQNNHAFHYHRTCVPAHPKTPPPRQKTDLKINNGYDTLAISKKADFMC